MTTWRLVAAIALHVIVASASSSGTVAWSTNFTASFFGLPVVTEDKVFICGDATFLSLESWSGKVLWHVELDSPCQYADVWLDSVFVGSSSAVYAFSQWNGTLIWQYNFTSRPGTPARPTVGGNYVFFTVEDGFNSTRLRALNLWDGSVALTSETLATTRLWSVGRQLIYVELRRNTTNTSKQVLVSRSVDSFNVLWERPYTQHFEIASFGAVVAYNVNEILVLQSPTGPGAPSASISVLDGYTGKIRGTTNLYGATNNLDFTTSGHVFFSIMSHGPSFNTSTLTGYNGRNASAIWAKNLTTWEPNLVPGKRRSNSSRMDEYMIIVQGSHELRAFSAYHGDSLWTLPFPNPKTVIGITHNGFLYIGNTVLNRILAVRL